MEIPVLIGEALVLGSTTRTRDPFEKPAMAKDSPESVNRRGRSGVPSRGDAGGTRPQSMEETGRAVSIVGKRSAGQRCLPAVTVRID
jgi:hypothetical protein